MQAIFDWFAELFSSAAAWVLDLLPDWLSSGFSQLSELWASFPLLHYLGWLSGLDVVLPVTITAYIIRFSIRRLPVVG